MSSTSGHDDRPGAQEHGGDEYGAARADERRTDPLEVRHDDAPYGYGDSPHPRYPLGNGAAVASLVLGIVAILTSFVVVGLLFGILGLVFGIIGLRRARKGKAGRRGMAVTGTALSIVGIVLGVVFTIAWVGFGTFLFSNGATDYADCIQRAGGDAAAQQQCAQQFNRQLNDAVNS